MAKQDAKAGANGPDTDLQETMPSLAYHELIDAKELTQISSDLRLAVVRDQLRLFLQPIVDLNKVVIGYEALLRWQCPRRGLVSPKTFIDLSERNGMIFPIGEWVITTACEFLAHLDGLNTHRHITISVNVSPSQFAHHAFVDDLIKILQVSGAPPNRLKLEITEGIFVTNKEEVAEKLHQLKAVGVKIALDDFGTGYSSLSYLKTLPLDQLKIDQSFLKDLMTDPVDSAIVQTILNLAAILGIAVVAEGVEYEGQYKALAGLGCKYFQGYLFGRPAPAL
jgi:EAL domain-containing protein (putative c-di-GMP-specific phosphodiesterase class I)